MPLGWATGMSNQDVFLAKVNISGSLMNDRFGKGKGSDRKKITSAGIHRINHATGETVCTSEVENLQCSHITVCHEREKRSQLGEDAISYGAGGTG
jgi:hypothetical protein